LTVNCACVEHPSAKVNTSPTTYPVPATAGVPLLLSDTPKTGTQAFIAPLVPPVLLVVTEPKVGVGYVCALAGAASSVRAKRMRLIM